MNELKEIKLNKLEELASDYEIILREELNIPIATNITYSINTRAKKRYGMCSLEDKYYTVYHIEISSFLLDNEIDENNDALINTLIHELLHTVEGCMNHGNKWQYYASIVKDKLGYDIKRTSNRSEYGLESYVPKENIKYIFKCENCGQIIRRRRKSNFTKYYNLYTCGVCNGKFERLV